MQPGYYRDYDSWLYRTSSGAVYLVSDGVTADPVWRDVGEPMPDDAVAKTPDEDDLKRLPLRALAAFAGSTGSSQRTHAVIRWTEEVTKTFSYDRKRVKALSSRPKKGTAGFFLVGFKLTLQLYLLWIARITVLT